MSESVGVVLCPDCGAQMVQYHFCVKHGKFELKEGLYECLGCSFVFEYRVVDGLVSVVIV